MDAWDLDAVTAKWQERWWEEKIHHADRGEGGRPTFFIHFAYPGISGYLHVGHMRGFTYADVLARFKRLTGHDVLFPAGFHASGIPAVAFAKEVERGEKTEYLRANGYEGPIEDLADPRRVVDYFARVYTKEYWKRFGFLIDDRRDCTTIDPGYNRFIQWQFRRLMDLGYIVEKPHYAPYCPVAGPVAVDRSETDIKAGGEAEVLEFVALRFRLAGRLAGVEGDVVLPCATLRPETLFGVTNLWVRPDHEYELVRVWRDGAVADDDPSEVWVVSRQGRVKAEWQFERAEALGRTLRGEELVDCVAVAPLTGREVPVVAGAFVDPLIATGVVMSVPGHAPFDLAAYEDAGLGGRLGEPPKLIDVEGVEGLPARLACQRHGVRSQEDKAALEAATEEVYLEEFSKGVLNGLCGPYAGQRVREVKDRIRADFLEADHCRLVRQFSEPVVSREGGVVDIRRVPDQAFVHYGHEAWTEVAVRHAGGMTVLPPRYHEDLPNVLRWFGDRACIRRGSWLGTEYPFKEGWIVEPISDSTFYSWYYLVSLYVNDGRLAPEDLTDAFFDHVFNGRGTPQGPRAKVWEEVRRDVLHWGPVDVNLGGKEHQTVHFPVWIMNNVALLEDPRQWPRGIFVNWWVTQSAGAKISKSKGGAEPIPGAARTYGVDPMRLYYCHVGSAHVDIEWDPEVVLGYRQHVLRVARLADDLLAAGGEATDPGIDLWLESAFSRHLERARQAFEAMDLRTAAGELLYGVPETLRWHRRRGGSARLLRQVVRDWARALSPVVPHVAEEMHARAGGDGLCAVAGFPEWPAPRPDALAREEYLRAVLEDVQTVRRLAAVERPRALWLFTSPAWKRDLARRAVELAEEARGRVPVGDLMREVMGDPAMRGRGKEVQRFVGRLAGQVSRYTGAQRALLQGGLDEAEVLRQAAGFVAEEVGVPEVRVHAADAADAPRHSKRGVAAPLKPGIALE